MTTTTTSRLGFRVVGSIAVDVENHVTGMVSDGGIWVSGTIVQDFGEVAKQ